MDNDVTFKKIIEKNDLSIYFFFTGKNPNNINPNDIYPIIDDLENYVKNDFNYDELLNIIRTILKPFIEDELVLNFERKNINYVSRYKNSEIEEFIVNKSLGNNMNLCYDYSGGINKYSITFNNSKYNDELFNYFIDDIPSKIKKYKK